MTADSDRVATDQQIRQFVLDRGLCLENCPNHVAVIVVDKGDFLSCCEDHFRNLQANYPSHNQLRIRPAPRKIATPEDALEFLRGRGFVAINPNLPQEAGVFRDAKEAATMEKGGAEILWLVDPEETS